jgi:signal transduction histidine kinase/ActR/RegA family two-component response regulator
MDKANPFSVDPMGKKRCPPVGRIGEIMDFKKRLGEILAESGVTTQTAVETALERQKQISRSKLLSGTKGQARETGFSTVSGSIPLLGQVLIDMNAITSRQLDQALEKQHILLAKCRELDSDALCSVLDMGTTVNSSLDLIEVLSMIMQNVNRVTGSVASTLMLVEETSGELVFSIPTGPEADKLANIRIQIGQGIAGWVAENGQVARVSNVKADPRFFPGIDELSGFQTESILAVPLRTQVRTIGVLEVINKANGSSFTEEDAVLLSIFAEQAAMAIENARLHGRLEEQARQTIRLQEQLAETKKFSALSELSTGMAHDFRNILNAIIGFAEIAILEIENKEVRQDIEEIINASNRASDLVDQIMFFTRKTDYRKISVNGNKLLKQSLRLFRSYLPTAIDLEQNFQAEEASIMADPSQINQLIMAILENAEDAIGEKEGSIRVETSVVELDETEAAACPDLTPGTFFKIGIIDNGCGMDGATLDRAFDPYFTTKKRGMGTGMGLAAADGIAKVHSGAIQIASVPEKGTTVEIFIPKDSAKEKTTESDLLPKGKERILLIDDEEMLQVVISRMLIPLGYHLTVEGEPAKALERFQEKPDSFDLVITDLAMPGIRGDSLARKMIEIRPDIKVILYSAFTDDVDLDQFLSIGIRDTLQKPVVMKDLAQTVRRILDEK